MIGKEKVIMVMTGLCMVSDKISELFFPLLI